MDLFLYPIVDTWSIELKDAYLLGTNTLRIDYIIYIMV